MNSWNRVPNNPGASDGNLFRASTFGLYILGQALDKSLRAPIGKLSVGPLRRIVGTALFYLGTTTRPLILEIDWKKEDRQGEERRGTEARSRKHARRISYE